MIHKKTSHVSPISLLTLPLVQKMYSDKRVPKIFRAVDNGWAYSGFIKRAVPGFNPFSGAIYMAKNSYVASWWNNPLEQACPQRLPFEIFMAFHDYLHVWAWIMVRDAIPTLGFGIKPITAENFEDFVFCHILTETMATIATDYWFLCKLDMEKQFGFTDAFPFKGGLQTGYHISHQSFYHNINPSFDAQKQEFFDDLLNLYCFGKFKHFSIQEAKQDERLDWVMHETIYGNRQRGYIRQWLTFLSQDQISIEKDLLHIPIKIDKTWKKKLAANMKELVWEFIQEDGCWETPVQNTAELPFGSWVSSKNKNPDFRFLNLNAMDFDSQESIDDGSEFYLMQLLSQFEFAKVDSSLIDLIGNLFQQNKIDSKLLALLMLGQERVSSSNPEPRDLFILG